MSAYKLVKKEGTYAVFMMGGIKVDLLSFFKTEAGKKALKDVQKSGKSPLPAQFRK